MSQLVGATAVERIAADYPTWKVTRSASGLRPGQWVATHADAHEAVTAPSLERLLTLLEVAELGRLRRGYSDSWSVWRAESSWMATSRKPGVEPTLMHGSPAELEAAMRNPSTWGQRPRAKSLR